MAGTSVARSDKGRHQKGRCQQKPSLFLECWNVDWESRTPIHHCRGCCGNIEDSRERLFSAAMGCDLLMSSEVRLPSADDWGSCGQAAAHCSLAMLVHNVLGYCFEVGFPSWSELEQAEVDADDEVGEQRRKIQKKAYRSTCVLRDNAQRRNKMLLTWIGASLESLISELQHLQFLSRFA